MALDIFAVRDTDSCLVKVCTVKTLMKGGLQIGDNMAASMLNLKNTEDGFQFPNKRQLLISTDSVGNPTSPKTCLQAPCATGSFCGLIALASLFRENTDSRSIGLSGTKDSVDKENVPVQRVTDMQHKPLAAFQTAQLSEKRCVNVFLFHCPNSLESIQYRCLQALLNIFFCRLSSENSLWQGQFVFKCF